MYNLGQELFIVDDIVMIDNFDKKSSKEQSKITQDLNVIIKAKVIGINIAKWIDKADEISYILNYNYEGYDYKFKKPSDEVFSVIEDAKKFQIKQKQIFESNPYTSTSMDSITSSLPPIYQTQKNPSKSFINNIYGNNSMDRINSLKKVLLKLKNE